MIRRLALVLALLLYTAPVQAVSLSAVPEAFWNLDDGTAGSLCPVETDNQAGACDLNQACAVGGMTVTASGKISQAITGNGSQATPWINTAGCVGSGGTLTMSTTQSFTVTAWFNLSDNTHAGNVVQKGECWNSLNTGCEFMLLYDAVNTICFYVADGTGNTSVCDPTSFSNGTWHFVVGWLDVPNAQLHIQIDNGTVRTTSSSRTSQATTAAACVGNRCEGNANQHQQFAGTIDAVGIWKAILTADDRTALYNSGNGVQAPFTLAGTGNAGMPFSVKRAPLPGPWSPREWFVSVRDAQ